MPTRLCTDLGLTLVLSFLPVYAAARHVTQSQIGLMVGIPAAVGMFMVSPLVPVMISRFGTVRSLMASTAFVTLVFPLRAPIAYASSDTAFLLCYAVVALVYGCATAAAEGSMGTLAAVIVAQEDLGQASGGFVAVRSLGSLCGPPVGGFLYDLALRLRGASDAATPSPLAFALPFCVSGAAVLAGLLNLHCTLRSRLARPAEPAAAPAAADPPVPSTTPGAGRWIGSSRAICWLLLYQLILYMSLFFFCIWLPTERRTIKGALC
jgi:MFS family permease